ncbi:MAG: hypothetical protein WKG07_26730 [Hymenobacter sp.]
MADGRILQDRGHDLAGRRHGQAPGDGRLAGPHRGHRPRRDGGRRWPRWSSWASSLPTVSAAVQGFGNVGSWAAKLLARQRRENQGP